MGKNNNFRTNHSNATSFSSGESYNLGVTIGGLQNEIASLRHELEEYKKELPEKIEHQVTKILEVREKDKKTLRFSWGGIIMAALGIATAIWIANIQLRLEELDRTSTSSQSPATTQEAIH